MPRKRVRKPTYEADIVGPISRVDERDIVFARADLFRRFKDGDPERERYYEAHPERRAYDERIAGMRRIGGGGGEYTPLLDGIFDAVHDIAAEHWVDGSSAEERTMLGPADAAARVKQLAKRLGAEIVGVGPLRQEWVYSRVGRSFGNAEGFDRWGSPIDLTRHTTAVAMAFPMDSDFLRAAPEFPTVLATATAYAVSAWASIRLAKYIRGLGYSARAHHLYNYRVLAVPVAVDCGIGELSRAGFLMTRKLGLGLRLGIVTTDLPMTHDEPVDQGIQSFCERCEICAENCPSGAIPFGPKVEHNGVRKWKLDEQKCYQYWHVVGTDCAVCMSTCPWTKPPSWLHRSMLYAAAISGPHQRLMVIMEKLFYGNPAKSRRGLMVGLESLRPLHLRIHTSAMAATVAGLLGFALWWGGRVIPPSGGIRAWTLFLAALLCTLSGVAVVWTLIAEHARRAAAIGAALFVGASIALAATFLQLSGL